MKLSSFISIAIIFYLPRIVCAQDQVDTVLAKQYYEEGNTQFEAGDYTGSLTNFEEAFSIYESSQAWPQYLEVLIKISQSYGKLGQLEKALELAQKALKVSEDRFGKSHEKYGEALHNIGVVYSSQGAFKPAMENYQKALVILNSSSEEQNPKIATLQNDIGTIYRYNGEFDLALENFIQSLSAKRSIYGEMHVAVASSYRNIGIIYALKFEYEKALENFHRASSILEKSYGKDHPLLARSLANTANVYIMTGSNTKALEHYENALVILKKVFNENHPQVGSVFMNMGIAYMSSKDYEKALEHYEKGLTIQKHLFGENHPVVASSLNNIGEVHSRKGDYETALIYLQQALQIQKRLFGQTHPDVALSIQNIGEVYAAMGNSLGPKYMQEAVEIRKKIFGENHPLVTFSFNMIGLFHQRRGAYDLALNYYQQALIANFINFEDTSVYENPVLDDYRDPNVLFQTLNSKAHVFEKRYEKNRTLRDLEFSLQIYELCDKLTDTNRKFQVRYEDKIKAGKFSATFYQSAIRVCKTLAEVKNDDSYRSQAFYFSEKSKAAILFENLSGSNAKSFSGLPEDLLLYEQSLKVDQSYSRSMVLEMKSQTQGFDTVKFNRHQNNLFETGNSLDSLARIFEQNYPKYFQLKYLTAPLSIEGLQKKLSARQALIEYAESDSNLFVFAITKTDFWIEKIEKDSLLSNSINQYIGSFDPLLIQKEFSAHFLQFAASASNLYSRLLHPIIQKLPTTVDHLILVPTDKLSYAPWELFVRDQGDAIRNKDYKSLSYLLNDYSVSYAHSASLLFQDISTSSSSSNQSVLAFAPSYDENLGESYPNLASVFRDELVPLKWNVSEVDEIKQYFDGNYQTGSSATETFFKETTGEHTILHLAMHAFVDDEDPMLSRLVFYQDNDSTEDGMLHVHELFNLDLSTEMAVLSACKTGLGKIQKGEGIMSLGRAFSYAGCPSIVTSHWSVDDESTSQLMGSFYKYLADGRTKDKALQQAKLDFLQNTNGLKTHPYYWGGFVVLGDTKPLSSSTNTVFIIFAIIMVVVPVIVWLNLRKNSET